VTRAVEAADAKRPPRAPREDGRREPGGAGTDDEEVYVGRRLPALGSRLSAWKDH